MHLIDWDMADRIVDIALEEDIRSGDVTTAATVRTSQMGSAQIMAKKSAVIAGLFMVERIYGRLGGGVETNCIVAEGSHVPSDTVLCQIKGPFARLLAGERTVLNFLQRMSGIATLTRRYVNAVKRTSARIYDTRKTAPGMRCLDKYAVRAGGGSNHRMGLYDAILIKDNHIAAAGGVVEAIRRTRKSRPGLKIEIEVRTMEELVLAVEYGADIALLDNMTLGDVSKASALVGERIELEVSGGVRLPDVRRIAQTGVHRISVGALTHSAPACDLSMMIVKA